MEMVEIPAEFEAKINEDRDNSIRQTDAKIRILVEQMSEVMPGG